MKKRYSIGFFAAFFLIISLLAIGYQLSYQYRMDKQEAKTAEEEIRSSFLPKERRQRTRDII